MKQKSVFLTIALLLGLRIAATAQTPPSYVPTNGLVGWWPFNGNANDESGNGNNGTVNGATLTEDRFGVADRAYGFDGVSNFIKSPTNNFPSLNKTISLWLSPLDFNQRGLLGYGGSGICGDSYLLHLNMIDCVGENKLTMQSHCCADTISIPISSISINQWNHLCYAADSNGTKIYVNGTLQRSSLNFYNTFTNSTDFAIGTIVNYYGNAPFSDSNANFYYGSLDDIGVWSRALTSEEIIAIYTSEACSNDLSISPENITANFGDSALLIANTSDVNPIYTWQTDFGQGFQNVVDYGNYSGASTSTLTISDLQLINHNQPIRVISTSGSCIDTSAVVLISIADTCITNVIDTSYITVTDTLIINLNPTGFNPVTYSNTILMYPNPTSEELTINYGDFASLAGYTLKIFNFIGQEIHSANINQQQEVLQLGTWGGAGTYQVVIYNAQGVPVDTRAIVLQ